MARQIVMMDITARTLIVISGHSVPKAPIGHDVCIQRYALESEMEAPVEINGAIKVLRGLGFSVVAESAERE